MFSFNHSVNCAIATALIKIADQVMCEPDV
jgi:hypothetical protein